MKKIFWITLISVLFCGPLHGEPLTDGLARSALVQLLEQADRFPEVEVGTVPGRKSWFAVDLHENPLHVGQTHLYNAVRFRTPPEVGLDLVWAFSVPRAWAHWFILKTGGTSDAGFTEWFQSEDLYADVPWAPGSYVVLQPLSGAALVPDAEYLIWFHAEDRTATGTVHGAINFVPPPGPGGWDKPVLEAALGLETASFRERVAHLGSRGANVLLDTHFFAPDYAKERIKTLFRMRDQVSTASSGFTVARETNAPPCETTPSLLEIAAAHGNPDFVIPDIQGRANPDDGYVADKETWHYDHFGFVTRTSDKTRAVQSVTAGVIDYSSSHQKRAGLSFDELPLTRTHVFYENGEELARIGFLGFGPVEPYTGEIKPGVYRHYHPSGWVKEELDYQGAGAWQERHFAKDGRLVRDITATNFLYQGMAHEYYEDASVRAEAQYEAGRLHGWVRWFSRDGSVTREVRYERGREAAGPDAPVEP